MINLSCKLPEHVYVACSGGVDSMAAVHFLRRKHKVTAVFFHHGDKLGEREYFFLKNNQDSLGYEMITCVNKDIEVPANTSQEEHWRNCRYTFFKSLNIPIITCHHLDDCVETWIWSSLHGEGKIIPFRNGNVIRPFRATRKQAFIDWATKHNVPWIEDESNKDTRFMRNFIRHELMPKALVVNPGLHKVIKKKIESENEKL